MELQTLLEQEKSHSGERISALEGELLEALELAQKQTSRSEDLESRLSEIQEEMTTVRESGELARNEQSEKLAALMDEHSSQIQQLNNTHSAEVSRLEEAQTSLQDQLESIRSESTSQTRALEEYQTRANAEKTDLQQTLAGLEEQLEKASEYERALVEERDTLNQSQLTLKLSLIHI